MPAKPKYRPDPELTSVQPPRERIEQALERAAERSAEFRHTYETSRLVVEIANEIRALREDERLTQQQLADRLHVAQSFIARLENPRASKRPSLDTLERVAEVLGKRLVIEFREDTALGES